MKGHYLKKLNAWFMEGIATVRTEGASEQKLMDPAVADLVLRRIFEEYFQHLRLEYQFIREVFAVVSDKTGPDHLRRIATQARKEGDLEIGDYLELIAQYREELAPE